LAPSLAASIARCWSKRRQGYRWAGRSSFEKRVNQVSDQLFRREFIDPKMPGHKSNSGEMQLGKALVARMKLLLDPDSAKHHVQFSLIGFRQDTGFRVFTFEGTAADHTRTAYTVRADLALTRKHGIRVQDSPCCVGDSSSARAKANRSTRRRLPRKR